MGTNGKSLAEQTAETIIGMIHIDKKFKPEDKLPNENELSKVLNVSRTTLREAVRILAAQHILEIRRGKGTYVKASNLEENLGLDKLTSHRMDVKDLYEMRLIFEPECAYYAAKRASDREIRKILQYGKQEEELILRKEDRTEADQAFHKAIAKATHNEFIHRLMPILYEAIDKGVHLSQQNDQLVRHTLEDHRSIMDFLEKRDSDGARTAMKLHIIHGMRGLGIEGE